MIRLIERLKFVPEVQVGGGEGNLSGLIGALTAKYSKELAVKKPAESKMVEESK